MTCLHAFFLRSALLQILIGSLDFYVCCDWPLKTALDYLLSAAITAALKYVELGKVLVDAERKTRILARYFVCKPIMYKTSCDIAHFLDFLQLSPVIRFRFFSFHLFCLFRIKIIFSCLFAHIFFNILTRTSDLLQRIKYVTIQKYLY